MFAVGIAFIVHFLVAAFFVRSALSVQCYACQQLPCSEMTCEGSWCMKAVVYDRNKDYPKIVADCVPDDIRDRVKKEECEDIRNDDLGLWGTRCFCKTKLCNGAVRRHINPVTLDVSRAQLLASFHGNIALQLALFVSLFQLFRHLLCRHF